MAKVIHFDITADDPQRAMAFYQQVFGWKFDQWDGPMDYWLITTGPEDEPGIGGGLAPRGDEGQATLNTIGVESLDEALKGVKENGGKVTRDKSAVPGVGWIGLCRDTEGNAFAVMELDPTAE